MMCACFGPVPVSGHQGRGGVRPAQNKTMHATVGGAPGEPCMRETCKLHAEKPSCLISVQQLKMFKHGLHVQNIMFKDPIVKKLSRHAGRLRAENKPRLEESMLSSQSAADSTGQEKRKHEVKGGTLQNESRA